nr:hypothetical protein [Marseillevirus cajuinensis]
MRLSIKLVNPGVFPNTIFYFSLNEGESFPWRLLHRTTKDCETQAFLLSTSCKQTCT